MKLFRDIKDFADNIRRGIKGVQGSDYFVPTLQSDYTIAIVPNYSKQVNTNSYEPVLVQSLSLPNGNGFNMTMDKLGMQSADFNASGMMSFTYIGVPYTNQEKVYTSIIHYYYSQRFTESGLLKIKTKNLLLPTIFVINLKTNNIVYVLKNCTFSYPKFTANPTSNSISMYETSVGYSSYQEYLFDNIDSTKGQDIIYRQNKETDLRDLSMM